MESYKRFLQFMKGGDKPQGTEGLARELQKELNILKEYLPHLDDELKKATVENFTRSHRMDVNPVTEMIDDDTLRRKTQAPERVRAVLHQVSNAMESYTHGFVNPQSARTNEIYQEFMVRAREATVENLESVLQEMVDKVNILK